MAGSHERSPAPHAQRAPQPALPSSAQQPRRQATSPARKAGAGCRERHGRWARTHLTAAQPVQRPVALRQMRRKLYMSQSSQRALQKIVHCQTQGLLCQASHQSHLKTCQVCPCSRQDRKMSCMEKRPAALSQARALTLGTWTQWHPPCRASTAPGGRSSSAGPVSLLGRRLQRRARLSLHRWEWSRVRLKKAAPLVSLMRWSLQCVPDDRLCARHAKMADPPGV